MSFLLTAAELLNVFAMKVCAFLNPQLCLFVCSFFSKDKFVLFYFFFYSPTFLWFCLCSEPLPESRKGGEAAFVLNPSSWLSPNYGEFSSQNILSFIKIK